MEREDIVMAAIERATEAARRAAEQDRRNRECPPRGPVDVDIVESETNDKEKRQWDSP